MTSMSNVLETSGVSLLTAPGGPYEQAPEVRRILALTTDGRLFISHSHRSDLAVYELDALLEHRDMKVSKTFVGLEEISRLYQQHEERNKARDINNRVRAGNVSRTSGINENSDLQLLAMRIIREAAELGTSDVHLNMKENHMTVRFRINGLLEDSPNQAEMVKEQGHRLQAAIYGSMCQGASADSTFRADTDQDGRLKEEWVKQAGLFGGRIATRPGLYGPNMVIRLLQDSTANFESLDDLGYLPEQIKLILPMVHQTSGMVLLSGITGSGKSMSLKAMIEELARYHNQQIHILTIEDPIEYRIRGKAINQTPLGCNDDDPAAIAKAWERSISNGVRLDIDAFMVGEIRDGGSAMAAFRAVLTGHGFFSSMHTADSTSNIQRLIDLGVDPSLVFDPSLVKGFINQCLTPVLCDHCKIPYVSNESSVSADLQERIKKTADPNNIYLLGPGCKHCRRGVVSRTPVAEVLSPDIHFMRVFRDHGKAEARSYWVKEMGGITKVAHGLRLLNAGRVDPRQLEADLGRHIDSDIKEIGA